ncbi:MAG: ADP-ribosylglycohydrolase family protein [Myxococcaceae bacterium]|nr:ADP-ribosylglycohydrolase family protein [Myxococcaceae bacterium]
MPLLLAQRQDRVRAALFGFAVGDALGFPWRGLPPASGLRASQLADDFASRPRGRFAKGQFSDDTQVMLALAESVAREGRLDGRVAAQQIAWLWQEGVILQPPAQATAAAEAILRGTPWMSAGAPVGVTDPSCLSRGVVIGVWSDDRPARLAHDAGVVAILTHKDPLCAAGVAAVARAVQLGLSGEPVNAERFCAEVSQAAAGCQQDLADELYYLPRVLGWDPAKALAALGRIGVPQSQLADQPGIPSHVTPVLLTALYACLKAPHDLREALNLVLRCGGEVDVAAGVVGAILGASMGLDAVPARLRKNLLYGEAVLDAADRLFDARLSTLPAVTASARTVAARR